MPIPKRGDLLNLHFNSHEHKQTLEQFVLVLSSREYNEITKLAVVCLITNQVKDYPFEVKLPNNLSVEGAILADQIKSIDLETREVKITDQLPEEFVQRCIRKVHRIIPIEEEE